jgi:P27 family predicted phage terminase small subunit
MQPGPKPEPTGLKLAKGNPGRRPLNENEPKPIQPDKPLLPPEWLSLEAMAEWHRVAPMLHELGLLTELDACEFAGYCEAVGTFELACRAIDREGETYETDTGFKRASPWVKIRRDAVKQIHEGAQRFGLTPADRTRIEVDPTPASDDLAAFNAEET